ncbi:MAG: hypothetical protein ACE14U_08040, partial [Candidatus Velamenicoccus archaeovorus]
IEHAAHTRLVGGLNPLSATTFCHREHRHLSEGGFPASAGGRGWISLDGILRCSKIPACRQALSATKICLIFFHSNFVPSFCLIYFWKRGTVSPGEGLKESAAKYSLSPKLVFESFPCKFCPDDCAEFFAGVGKKRKRYIEGQTTRLSIIPSEALGPGGVLL